MSILINLTNCFCIGLLLLCTSFGLCLAQSVEAQGSAMITHGALMKARAFALQDAIRQALLQSSASISSSSSMNAHSIVVDSVKLRTSGEVRNVQILDEWEKDELYHVHIRAEISETNDEHVYNMRYRKKVGFLQLEVDDRKHTYDLPNIEIIIPQLLQQSLEETGSIIPVDATPYLLHGRANNNFHNDRVVDENTVTRLAESLDVQVLVSGIIKEMGIKRDFIGGTRFVVIELHMYDGITGIMFARHTYHDSFVVKNNSASDQVLTLASFVQSELGKAMNTMLKHQTRAVYADISRLPMSARVVNGNGKNITVDVGSTSLVQVGDVFMAYQVNSNPVYSYSQRHTLGQLETPVATLTIKRVQPRFSIGELETEEIGLNPGDIVRFVH